MIRTNARIPLIFLALLCCKRIATCQVSEDHLVGADKNEHALAQQEHLFGDWQGIRPKLLEKGVKLDILYAGDQLWNVDSEEKDRLAVWTRVRGTLDWDLGQSTRARDLSLHMTAVWQGGGNLGNYLSTQTGPSGLASGNTFRLDSWWFEKRLLKQRMAVRAGQFAAQDSYGDQFFGGSFIFEPFQYGLGNRGAVYESFDPPSTPAAEVRVSPLPHTYLKAMVFAADRFPYTHNLTGLVPQFRGAAGSAYEVGYVPGTKASVLKPQDTVEARRGYSGLYRLGASLDPSTFKSTASVTPVSGNYLIYGSANQAVYRRTRDSDQGIDIAVSIDWTPPDKTNANQDTDIGIRFNEPLPLRRHNTIGLAWVRTGLSAYPGKAMSTTQQFSSEHALELNTLIELPRGLLLQPVAQYYLHSSGSNRSAFVLGFHTKIDF